MSDEYWLISIRNQGEPSPGDDHATTQEISKLNGKLSESAQVFRFNLPDLRVGTLEKLMNAGDLLHKVDLNIEAVVRKIERQFEELNKMNEVLNVEGAPPDQYLQNFRWNAAKYPTQRAVDELIRNIVQNATKTENELKESASYCTEKKQKVQAMERQKGGNLMVADLADILTPKLTADMIHDSTYLKSVVVIVPKALEKDFLAGYDKIGDDLVGYGPEEDRGSVKGSPVVPGSAEKITEDKEGFSAYLVTILSKFLEEFKVAAQTSRFLVRDYDFESSYEAYQRAQLEGGVDQLTLTRREYEEASLNLLHFTKSQYGDAFMAWIHIKAIRLFVESVLRYGLPVHYTAALIKPKSKSAEKKTRDKLNDLYSCLDTSGLMQLQKDESSTTAEEMFPYVSYKVNPKGEKK